MILQVHDELVFELPTAEAEKHSKWIANEMTNAIKLDVPLKVDITYGPAGSRRNKYGKTFTDATANEADSSGGDTMARLGSLYAISSSTIFMKHYEPAEDILSHRPEQHPFREQGTLLDIGTGAIRKVVYEC